MTAPAESHWTITARALLAMEAAERAAMLAEMRPLEPSP
jgi:hypothetical protein